MQTAALVPAPKQTRTDAGIGASSAAAAIGVSEYSRPIDAWLVHTGRREPFAGNEKTYWGNTLEPIIRAHYVEKHQVAVHVPPVSLFHRDLSFVRATPDGIVLDETGKWLYVGPQVKNVGWRMEQEWKDDGGNRTAPIDYYIQGVVEMAVTDLPRIDFAVFCGGQQYFEVTIERDRSIEGDVLEQLAAFWKLVQTDTQPELDDSESFRGHLLKQIKRRVHVEASTERLADIERWRDVAVQMKQLKREEGAIKNRIAAELAAKDAARMVSPIGDITIGNPRKKTAWKAIAESMTPLCSTMHMLDRELAVLRGDVANLVSLDHPTCQRLDGLRAQVRLVSEITSYSELVARHTTHGDPTINRPRAWTKEAGDEGNEEEG